MQVEEKRACPTCGAENAAAAAFCWKCFASFAPAAGPPIPTRPGAAMPPAPSTFNRPGMQGSDQASQPVEKRGSKLVAVVVGTIVAAAAFGVQRLLDGPASLPDSIGGVPRMTSGLAQDFEREMESMGDQYDLDIAAAAYGSSEIPDFLVILVDESAIESTDELFESFLDGVAQGGAGVDRAGQDSGTRDGVDYRCVPMSGAGLTATGCMWRGSGDVGIVLRIGSGVEETKTTLWAVHDAVA